MNQPAILNLVRQESVGLGLLEGLRMRYGNRFIAHTFGSAQEATDWLEDYRLQAGELLLVILSEFLFTESADDLIPHINRLFPDAKIILIPDSFDISVGRLALWKNVILLPQGWINQQFYDHAEDIFKNYERFSSATQEGYYLGIVPKLIAELNYLKATGDNSLVSDFLNVIFKGLEPHTVYYLMTEQGKLKIGEALSADPQLMTDLQTDTSSEAFNRVNQKAVAILTDELQATESNRFRSVVPIYWNGKINSYLLIDNTPSRKEITRAQKDVLTVLSHTFSQLLEQQYLGQRLAERTRLVAEQKDKEEEQKMIIELVEKELQEQILFSHSIQESSIKQGYDLQDLFPESFLIYQTAQPVSTAFYWFRERYHRFMLSVADCTEPGVSSAFVSLIASYLLDSISETGAILTPTEVLRELNLRFRRWFKNDLQSHVTPLYLNLGFCSIDQPNQELLYSGAGHRLVLVRNGEAILLEGEREPLHVNAPIHDNRPFQLHTLPLEPNDTIYLFSNAWALLFNHSRVNRDPASLVKTVTELHALSLEEQEKAFQSTVNHWKRDNRLPYDLLLMVLRWNEG